MLRTNGAAGTECPRSRTPQPPEVQHPLCQRAEEPPHSEAQRAARDDCVREIARQVGERFGPARASFKTYKVYHPNQRPVVEKLTALTARLPDAIANGESIVLYGTPGTGKDHLLAALAYIAAGEHAFHVEWWQGLKMFDQIRRYQLGEVLASLPGCVDQKYTPNEVFVVSDPVPPAADPSESALNQFFGIIDRRYAALWPTWMTVNVPDEETLRDKLTPQLVDRLSDGGHFIPCFWPSFRTKAK